MKTKIFTLALIIVSHLSATGCNTLGFENVTKESRTVDKFSGIELKNVANVNITIGEIQNISVEAEEDFISHVLTTVKNDVLIISSDKESGNHKSITVNITVPDLSSLNLSGSGNIMMQNLLTVESMSIKLSGSGNINAQLEAKSLQMILSGAGNIDVKGNVKESEIVLSGSGNIDGRLLQTFASDIKITGSGTSIVDVDDNLTVNITGSGNVLYISDPERIHSKINGSGRIEKMKA